MTLFGEGSPSQTSNDTMLTLLLSSPTSRILFGVASQPGGRFLERQIGLGELGRGGAEIAS